MPYMHRTHWTPTDVSLLEDQEIFRVQDVCGTRTPPKALLNESKNHAGFRKRSFSSIFCIQLKDNIFPLRKASSTKACQRKLLCKAFSSAFILKIQSSHVPRESDQCLELRRLSSMALPGARGHSPVPSATRAPNQSFWPAPSPKPRVPTPPAPPRRPPAPRIPGASPELRPPGSAHLSAPPPGSACWQRPSPAARGSASSPAAEPPRCYRRGAAAAASLLPGAAAGPRSAPRPAAPSSALPQPRAPAAGSAQRRSSDPRPATSALPAQLRARGFSYGSGYGRSGSRCYALAPTTPRSRALSPLRRCFHSGHPN